MTNPANSIVRCADGTEIPMEWVYADAPECEWMHDREHWPDAMTPMELWLWNNGWAGADRAWNEIRMEPPSVFYRFQMVGPFLYARETMYPMERMATIASRYIEVSQEYGNAASFWNTYCEPRIQRSCAELAAMDAGVGLRAAADLWFYGFHQTFTCLSLLFIPGMRMRALLTEFVGEDAELLGFEVTQGGDNATQAIDAEIWELAEMARATPVVASIIEANGDGALDALRRDQAATAFVAAFDVLIARHGRRSQAWMLTGETWGERPDAALALIRAQLGADAVSPDELRERTARRRLESTERVLAALPPEKHEEFRGIVNDLEGYVNVREGRAYWQLVISGEVRGLLLRTGAELVRNGRIDDAADILYLTPDDLDAAGASDLHVQVAAGRAEWERWCRLNPPAVIGTPGEAAAAAEAMRAELRGAPASRGQVTGTARILHSPEEGDRLQKGDILVCVMTTPAWTPLFAIAGGIVTETGGALSHPAITAREYGIPAVVALHEATTRIKDGQVITVDGAKGTVEFRD